MAAGGAVTDARGQKSRPGVVTDEISTYHDVWMGVLGLNSVVECPSCVPFGGFTSRSATEYASPRARPSVSDRGHP
jgi:hypothetical protein